MSLVSLIFLVSPGQAVEPIGDLMPDYDFQNFESQFNPFIMVGTPLGPPTNASLSITSELGGVKNGNYALKFSYELNQNATPTLIDFRFLLTDLMAISFWIKSEKDADWSILLLDVDGALFLTNTVLSAGEWKQIWLRPDHFLPAAGVGKEAVDVSRLNVGLVMLDARNKTNPVGTNTVYIDDFTIARTPLTFIGHDYVVTGALDVIDEPTSIKGDLIIEDGAQLDVTASRFQIEGNVTVRNNSTLHLQNGAWQFLADYPRQFLTRVSNEISLIFTNGSLRLRVALQGEISTHSLLRFDTVRNGAAGVTFSVFETAALELINSLFIGEFILSNDTRSLARDSDLIIYWLQCDTVHSTPLIVPDGDHIESWVATADWNRDMTIENSSFVLWTFLIQPNCDLQIQDSDVRAVGLTYWGDVSAVAESLSGLQSKILHDNFCVDTSLSSICLLNTRIDTWNVYTFGSSIVDVIDSTLGEAIGFEDSQLSLTNTTIDASGGHLGSQNQAVVNFTSGVVNAHIRSYGTSLMNVTDSPIEGNVYVSDSTIVTLQDSAVEGQIFTFGDATVIQQ